MEQLITLEEQVQYGVEIRNETPTFVIKNFDAFKEQLEQALLPYASVNLTELNISLVEKQNAQIKKFATSIKQNAKKYVELFSLTLLGNRTTKGQCDILADMLMDTYNALHERTKEFRGKNTPKEKKFIITITTTDETKVAEIQKFVKKHDLDLKIKEE